MKLDELKALNAEAEQRAPATPQGADADDHPADEPVTENDNEPIAEGQVDDGDESEDSDDGDSGAEAWMDEKPSGGDGVPVQKHVAIKQRLKGQLRESRDQAEELRAENERLRKMLEQGQQQPVTPRQRIVPPPRLSDFDSEAQYQRALAAWQDKQLDHKLEARQKAAEMRQQQESVVQKRQQAVETHYERAAKLIGEHGIDPTVYQQADATVRRAIEAIRPDQGDAVTDVLIERLGEGSEKVLYFIGRNEQARATLVNKLIQDPTGIDASIYLGKLLAEKANAKKATVSNAPAPAARLKGGDAQANSSALLRKYRDAHGKKDVQKAYNIKKEAKAKGIDTSNW